MVTVLTRIRPPLTEQWSQTPHQLPNLDDLSPLQGSFCHYSYSPRKKRRLREVKDLAQATQLLNAWLQAHNHHGYIHERQRSKPSFPGEVEEGESLRQMKFLSWVERRQPEGKSA